MQLYIFSPRLPLRACFRWTQDRLCGNGEIRETGSERKQQKRPMDAILHGDDREDAEARFRTACRPRYCQGHRVAGDDQLHRGRAGTLRPLLGCGQCGRPSAGAKGKKPECNKELNKDCNRVKRTPHVFSPATCSPKALIPPLSQKSPG
jgi:hypothetical protein